MKNEMFTKIIAAIAPVLLCGFAVVYPLQFMMFSHSTVGRLFVFVAILFYTWVDIVFGLLAVAIVVLYYQSDAYENMTSLKDSVNENSLLE